MARDINEAGKLVLVHAGCNVFQNPIMSIGKPSFLQGQRTTIEEMVQGFFFPTSAMYLNIVALIQLPLCQVLLNKEHDNEEWG